MMFKTGKTLYTTLVFVLAAVFLSGCYMVEDSSSGDIALRATVPVLRAEPNTMDVWVVGIVLDAAYENDLKKLNRIFDVQDADPGPGEDYKEDEADDLLEKILEKGAVRFDGGRFFFQRKLTVGGSATETGSMSIAGIPAGKRYLLYISVFNREITSIDDFDDDDESLEAYMNINYFDPAEFSPVGNIPAGTKAGWYYFYEWDTSANPDGSNLALTDAVIWMKDGKPVSNQPFLVEAGKTTSIDILLVPDDDDE